MVYHSAGDDIRNKFNHSMPIKELIAFDRVRVELTGEKR
jgi:hypothetical protein